MVEISTIIGYTGASFITLGMSAQVHHCVVKNNYKELSVSRLFADFVTNSLYLAYGIMIANIPVCISSTAVVVACLILGVLYMKDARLQPSTTLVVEEV